MAGFLAMTTPISITTHFKRSVEKIEFRNYGALLASFERELHELWKAEDEQKDENPDQ